MSLCPCVIVHCHANAVARSGQVRPNAQLPYNEGPRPGSSQRRALPLTISRLRPRLRIEYPVARVVQVRVYVHCLASQPGGKGRVARWRHPPDRGSPCAMPLDECRRTVDRFMTPDLGRVTSLMRASDGRRRSRDTGRRVPGATFGRRRPARAQTFSTG